MKSYITVAEETISELVIRKSRFIATVAPVDDYDNAIKVYSEIKSRYSDATHNCYAFISDALGLEFKFGDDGEPQGTAGQPILEVLKKNGLHKTIIVVTRYFGGVKLGASGLVGAYMASAAGGIKAAKRTNMIYSDWVSIITDYSSKGKLDSAILKAGGVILESNYHNEVQTDIVIPQTETQKILGTIANITSGKGNTMITNNGYYSYTISEVEL